MREFWDRRGGVIEASDLATIARGQLANEETAAMRANRVMFCDTNLLMNVRWADDLFPGQCPDWVRDAADIRRYDLYLYCEPDLPWADDPQRSFREESAWRASAERVRNMLVERNLAHESIKGVGKERIRIAVSAVNQILSGSS